MAPATPSATPGAVSRFVNGLSSPWRGLKYLIGHPRLLPLAAMPALANIVVFVLVVAFLRPHAFGLVQKLLPSGGVSWYFLVGPAFILAWIAVLLLGILLVTLFSNVIAAPFNDALSEKVERIEGRLPEEKVEWKKLLSRFGSAVLVEVKKWAFYFVMLGALLLLHLIPIAGSLIWTVLSTLLSFWFLGFEYLDYCFSRRRYSFAQRRQFCTARWAETIGQGTAVAATLVLPPVTMLVMPLSVVGSTLLYLGLEKETPITQAPEKKE